MDLSAKPYYGKLVVRISQLQIGGVLRTTAEFSTEARDYKFTRLRPAEWDELLELLLPVARTPHSVDEVLSKFDQKIEDEIWAVVERGEYEQCDSDDDTDGKTIPTMTRTHLVRRAVDNSSDQENYY